MLPTNYRNDVLNTSVNEKRRYNIISNADDTVSFEEVTSYTQEGTAFGANDINATNTAINTINVYVGDDKKLHFVNGEGADSALPFNPLPYQIKISYRTRGNLTGVGLPAGGKHTAWAEQTAVFTKQDDDSYLLTSGGSVNSTANGIGAGTTLTESIWWGGSAEITGISFVYN